jgi:chromosome segregation ATPase
VRRLAASPGEVPGPEHDAGGPQESPGPAPDTALQQTVAGLEQKLASVRSRQRRLTAENAKLREQLQAAQRSLAQAEERASAAQVTGQLGGPELQLLERLLSAARDQPGRQEEAGAG